MPRQLWHQFLIPPPPPTTPTAARSVAAPCSSSSSSLTHRQPSSYSSPHPAAHIPPPNVATTFVYTPSPSHTPAGTSHSSYFPSSSYSSSSMPKAFDEDYRHNMYATHPGHAHQQHHHQQQQQQPTYYLPSQPNAHHYAPPPPQQHLPALPPVHANGNGYTYAMSNGGGGGANTSPTNSNSGSVRAGASPYGHGGHSARASPLHRGEACLTCRRRKMKCDAGKPSCGPCSRQGKADECEYEESRFLAQIARLESEVDRLRARVRELEGTASTTSTTSTSSADGAPSSDTPTTSPSGADYSAATNGGFTAYLPSSNVRRSPSDGGSTGGGGMGPPSVGNGSRPASAYGFYEGARPGTAHGGYSNFSGTNTPYSGTGAHTPSPPGMTPGTELAGEVFGRM